jgi:hypothetical protein
MALKRILTAAEFAALNAALKSEYKPEGDGYVLDLTDYEDPAALKRAKDHEKEARKNAEKSAKDLQDQLAALTEERDNILKGAIPKADVEKLESSYKTKAATREKELTDRLTALQGNLQTMLVDNVATSLASKLSTAPAVILPHIRARLSAEIADGKASTRVLDREGKLSALTIEDLEKEFIANKDFAPILVASKGSGGGAAGSGKGSGASKKLSEMTATEEAQFANANPEEYAKLVGQ